MNPVSKSGIVFASGPEWGFDAARAYGTNFRASYEAARPFPHIVIDDFLPEGMAEELLEIFPTRMGDGKLFDGRFEFRKNQTNPNLAGDRSRNLFGFFNSQPFLDFLESMTGIEGLIPDPYFLGGGFHEIYSGGHLGIHADFRVHRKMHVERRINALIYLNKNWRTQYGGNLELWNREMSRKEVEIAPIFNRLVVFNTDSDSFHGHPEPLRTPEDISRKSVALYYYTASREIYREVKDNSTVFRSRREDGLRARLSSLNRWRKANLRASDLLPPVVQRLFSRKKG